MMLTLDNIRGYIAGLGIAEDDNVYIGKLNNKKEHSIGVYNRKKEGLPNIALGGVSCTTYDIKPVSLLVHWDKNVSRSEEAAGKLYEKLLNESSLMIDGIPVNCLMLQASQPVDIGTDEGGVYEYVIWLDFYYERNR